MKNLNHYLNLFIFLILIYLFYLIIKPFIPPIITALAFAVIFYPLYKKLKLKIGDTSAALTTVILTFIFIILPLIILIGLIGNEAVSFAKAVDAKTIQEKFVHIEQIEFLNIKISLIELKDTLFTSIKSIGSYLSAKSFSIVSAIWNSIFLFFVFLLLFFYFLKDNEVLIDSLKRILPFEKAHQNRLFKSFNQISKTIFYGNLLSALLAGLIAFAGFSIFGFKGVIIWALLAMILSLIPTVGTLLLYLVGIVFMGFTSGLLHAILMLLFYIFVEVIFRENFINGKIMEDKLKFHPILVFIALVGGVGAFGSLGLIYGPLVIAFLGTLYQFSNNYKR